MTHYDPSYTLTLVVHARNAALFMTLSAPAMQRHATMKTVCSTNDLTQALPSRERDVILRILDSCSHYAERQDLSLAESAERIGMTMTQAYLSRANDQ
ncbi:hypothetical protein [Celeribacter marinus]|uniref:hypothetical protein n=1 Tax=Celeribacter marinus TaxID=1397108 RepID=UPI003F6C3BAF